jgi:hypothetical protein
MMAGFVLSCRSYFHVEMIGSVKQHVRPGGKFAIAFADVAAAFDESAGAES